MFLMIGASRVSAPCSVVRWLGGCFLLLSFRDFSATAAEPRMNATERASSHSTGTMEAECRAAAAAGEEAH
jgi:hypothetical protein